MEAVDTIITNFVVSHPSTPSTHKITASTVCTDMAAEDIKTLYLVK
jgi:hypothetical protein